MSCDDVRVACRVSYDDVSCGDVRVVCRVMMCRVMMCVSCVV